MKYYLSSYKLGDETGKLKKLIKLTSGKFGYIPNALDFTQTDLKRREEHIKSDMDDFRSLGAELELLDLRDYFDHGDKLKTKLLSLGGLYVSGGNTFILRQAMKISGLDKLITGMTGRENFLYSGYSAGVCVLSPTLRVYAITDNAEDFPYGQIKRQIWNGLGILNFVFQPHYASDHPESKSTDREIEYCIKNKILFKAFRDGEVLIIG